MTEKKDDASERHFGWFQAKYLWPLHSIVKYARETHPYQMMRGSIGLEPAPQGGAYISACSGHAMVVIHDATAHIDAPVTLDIPDAAFLAAKGWEGPILNYCGDIYKPDLPEWMQPDRVYVYSPGMHICTKMRNPIWAEAEDEFHPCLYTRGSSHKHHNRGLDYSMVDGLPIDVRSFLRKVLTAPEVTGTRLPFNPAVADLFTPLREMLSDGQTRPLVTHTLRSIPGMYTEFFFVLQFDGHPEIVGVWAGTKAAEIVPVPDHFYREIPAPAEAGHCPICAEPLKPGDTCATDITEGTCHAACLDGAAVVDLATGEPSEGPIDTFPYQPDEERAR